MRSHVDEEEYEEEEYEEETGGAPLFVRIMTVVLSLVLLVSAGALAVIYGQYWMERKTYTDVADTYTAPVATAAPADDDAPAATETTSAHSPLLQVSFTNLQATNPEVCAWIQMDNPAWNISYPVTHHSDNDYYLHRSFDGTANKCGTIFMDAANVPNFADQHTLLYGHNMQDKSMFSRLLAYATYDTWQAWPTFRLYTPNGNWEYTIFSAHQVPPDSFVYTLGFSRDETYAEYLDKLVRTSNYDTHVPVSVADDIITLSTCTADGNDRFVVHAVKSRTVG